MAKVRNAATELRCAFDLMPVPPRRRGAAGEASCSDRCKRALEKFYRRQRRKAARP